MKFQLASSPEKQLIVDDATQPIPPALEKAMAKLLAHNALYTPFNDFLSSNKSANQRSLVFMFRGILRIPPARCAQARDTVIACLKWLVQGDLHTMYAKEFGILKPHFDIALAESLKAFKAAGRHGKLWWASVKSYAKHLLPFAEFEALMTICKDDSFDRLERELGVFVKTEVGSLLFQVIAEQRVSRLLSQWIANEIASLGNDDIDEVVLASSVDRFLQ